MFSELKTPKLVPCVKARIIEISFSFFLLYLLYMFTIWAPCKLGSATEPIYLRTFYLNTSATGAFSWYVKFHHGEKGTLVNPAGVAVSVLR